MDTTPPRILERLGSLRERLRTEIGAVRQHISGIPPSDLRVCVLAKLINTVLSSELALALSADELRSAEWWDKHAPAIYALIQQGGNLEEIVQDVNRLILFGAMNSWFSVMESTLRQLCAALGLPEYKDYNDVYPAVFAKVLTNRQERKPALSVFNFARLIRNGIHTNYYHSSQTSIHKFLGKEYVFTKNALIEFADWTTAIDIFEETLNIIIKLIYSPAVISLPSIKDLHDRWP